MKETLENLNDSEESDSDYLPARSESSSSDAEMSTNSYSDTAESDHEEIHKARPSERPPEKPRRRPKSPPTY